MKRKREEEEGGGQERDKKKERKEEDELCDYDDDDEHLASIRKRLEEIGEVETAEVLEEELDSNDALFFACKNGHKKAVDILLLSPDTDVNLQSETVCDNCDWCDQKCCVFVFFWGG